MPSKWTVWAFFVWSSCCAVNITHSVCSNCACNVVWWWSITHETIAVWEHELSWDQVRVWWFWCFLLGVFLICGIWEVFGDFFWALIEEGISGFTSKTSNKLTMCVCVYFVNNTYWNFPKCFDWTSDVANHRNRKINNFYCFWLKRRDSKGYILFINHWELYWHG